MTKKDNYPNLLKMKNHAKKIMSKKKKKSPHLGTQNKKGKQKEQERSNQQVNHVNHAQESIKKINK